MEFLPVEESACYRCGRPGIGKIEPFTDGHRIVAFAAVTCRNDDLGGKWGEFVNPGIPIDAATMRTHGLTDARIAHYDAFATIAQRVLATLTPQNRETVVLCAHNTNLDVPILRRELERAGLTMPDLPLLDTMRGLARVAKVRPKNASLDALLAKLEIANPAAHDALGDAWATAKAARQMLDLAAQDGFDDLPRLLAQAGDGASTSVAYAAPRSGSSRAQPTAPERPDTHIASHSEILSINPSPDALADWVRQVGDCARLRCDLLVDRVAVAGAAAETLLPPLTALVLTRAQAWDVAGVATLLGAMSPLLAVPTSRPLSLRRAAVSLDSSLGPAVDPLGRCRRPDYCRVVASAIRVRSTCGVWLSQLPRSVGPSTRWLGSSSRPGASGPRRT